MSDFGEALFDLLPVHSSLQDKNNPGRKVLDNSIGEWFDHHDVLEFYDNLFIDTASGPYLDLFGRDYGVGRKLDESDDDYRQRIIQEKNDYLTPEYLRSVYGLTLYSYVTGFNVEDNTLASDNPYLNQGYMAFDINNVKSILNKKFALTNEIVWINTDGNDFILNTSDVDVYLNYLDVYGNANIDHFFRNDAGIGKVKLDLPDAVSTNGLFYGCSGLTEVELSIPNSTNVNALFMGCTSLDRMVIDMSNAVIVMQVLTTMFQAVNCSYVDITINNTAYAGVLAQYCKTNMSNLETLIINGEEVEL